ncbi:MAG: type II secretion system F family protein [Idiomarina sp.]|nr:type II secretion system F family protein [Idiomarina sp.]
MTVSFYLLGIVGALWFSLAYLPWGWLKQHCLQGMLRLGGWCYRCAPQPWQIAWQGVSYLQYRLAAMVLLPGLYLLLWIVFAPPAHGLGGLTLVICALSLGWPLARALRQQQARKASVIAALPAQLDLLAMLLVAGQPLLSSLQQSSNSGIDNPLREELRLVVSQVRAGVAVDEAFERLSARYPCRELRLFCSALHHARESGAGLAGILYEQAEQRRQELFLQAEKKAMEAPVKLMFPLLMFIFPGTVLVLVVTLAAKMMWKL